MSYDLLLCLGLIAIIFYCIMVSPYIRCILSEFNAKQPIIGGDIYDNQRLFISDYAKLVIDGNNLVHSASGKKMNVIQFSHTLKKVSHALSQAFIRQKIHIVLKNPNNYIMEQFKKVFKHKSKRTRNIMMMYFDRLIALSEQFPRITYHLAYDKDKGKDKKRRAHHLHARDDFLTIYLAKGGYMVSNDLFRDFSRFEHIAPFKHYSVTNGVVHDSEYINPKLLYRTLTAPNLGNHLTIKVVDQIEAQTSTKRSGNIYISNQSPFGEIYLVV